MSEPLVFVSHSSRYSLPLLFAGQAQKEFTVNEALCRADSLLHPAVEGEENAPPAEPVEGQCWLIGAAPTGAWAGKAGQLACFQVGSWLYTAPRDGMQILDRATEQRISFMGTWKRPNAPSAPTGGTTVDAEARTAINDLIAGLVEAGILRAV